jgi:hypothetical protein
VARVRLTNLAAADLPPEIKLHLTSIMITEWAIAQALIMVHGEEAGLRRYWQLGGHVHPGADKEPWIHYTEAEARAWLRS